MVKLLILNACLSFQLTGVDKINLIHAGRIQKAAIECKEKFGQCLESVRFTDKDENNYKVKYRCIKENK